MTRSVVVLGSTGSIGTQALEILAANRERFTVVGLSAGGLDAERWARARAGELLGSA